MGRAIAGAPDPVVIETSGVDRRVVRQIDWLTPGMAGTMIMWANLTVGATLIAWRERGTLTRLAVTPLRPLTLLATQVVSRLAFSCLQVIILLAVARGIFGVRPAGGLGALALVVLAGTLAILACGFVIGALVPRSESAGAVSTLVAFPMMFLGGSYFALDGAPAFLRPVIAVLPLTSINGALRQVMIHGAGVGGVQRELLALLAWTVAALLVAARAFRWGRS